MSGRDPFRRGGFTLVEMMLAVTIFSLVSGGLVASVVAMRKVATDAFATAELSVRTRELRDKLLYHAAPPHGGCVWAGIRSGGAEEGQRAVQGSKIRMAAFGVRTATGGSVRQTIELVAASRSGGGRQFVNDGDRTDERWAARWLDPGGIGFLADDEVDVLLSGNNEDAFAVNLRAVVRPPAQGEIAHAERIVVPVFGREVPTDSLRVFTDD